MREERERRKEKNERGERGEGRGEEKKEKEADFVTPDYNARKEWAWVETGEGGSEEEEEEKEVRRCVGCGQVHR